MLRLFTAILLGMSSSVTCPSNTLLIHHGGRSALVVTLAVALCAVLGDTAVLLLLLRVVPESLRATVTGQYWFWMVGALIMGYIAVGQLRSGRSDSHESAVAGTTASRKRASSGRPLRSAFSGFSVTAFNPFTWVWWIGLFGPGIATDGTIRYEFFGGILIGATLWFTLLATVVHMVRGHMTQRADTAIHIVSFGILGTYAIWLVVEGLSRLIV